MKIKQLKVTVRDLVEGYADNNDGGVVGYGGRLDIRPAFQREFIYKDKQREAVIESVTQGFPLNVMYWAVREDGGYEVIDGQQRTISICQYVTGVFSHNKRYFHNLTDDEQNQILDYELMVYACSGTPSQKLKWFRVINIAGVTLKEQELRNAVYSGPWVTDAKRYFSRTGGPAYEIGGAYLSGVANRQDYLETAIKWISGGDIEGYMSKMQNKPDATELWLYFQSVMNWVKAAFPIYRKEMARVAWGDLYNQFKDRELNPAELEHVVAALMADEDVTRKTGIYSYVFDGQERHLSIRAFSPNQIREAYERQGGVCYVCGEHFELAEMQADHIIPWSKGGRTVSENCRMLCAQDNRDKSDA